MKRGGGSQHAVILIWPVMDEEYTNVGEQGVAHK
jgi:hypothetical protein